MITVEGIVRFDPERDDVKSVELVRAGEVVTALTSIDPGEVRIAWAGEQAETVWWALRVEGDKVGAPPMESLPSGPIVEFLGPRITNFGAAVDVLTAYHMARGAVRPAAAHTGPIWVVVGEPGAVRGARAAQRAEEALVRLEDLEARLGDDRIEEAEIWDWVPYSDGVSIDHLRRNRAALLRAIAEARARYREILATTGE